MTGPMNDDEEFEGGWLHTEVGRQVRPVVGAAGRRRYRIGFRRLLDALRALLR
jgi:hypothetical protein